MFQDMAEETYQTYLVARQTEDEKDKFIKKHSREKLVEVIEYLHTDIQRLANEKNQSETDLNAQILAKTNEIAKVKERVKEINDEKNSLETQLLKSQTLVEEKKNEIEHLEKRVVDHDDASDKDILDPNAPKTLLIVDQLRQGIVGKLLINSMDKYTDAQDFDDMMKMLSDEEHREKLYIYDKVIISLGMKDIIDGNKSITVFKKAKHCISKLHELECDVAILELTRLPGSKGSEASMFNRRLPDIRNIQIIKISDKFADLTIDEVLQDDGVTPLQETVDQISKAVNDQYNSPVKKDKTGRKPLSEKQVTSNVNPGTRKARSGGKDLFPDHKYSKFIPFDPEISGLIIGTKGSIINDMQQRSNTKMKVIEITDQGPLVKGVVIRGRTQSDVDKGKSEVLDKIEEAKRRPRMISENDDSPSAKKLRNK